MVPVRMCPVCGGFPHIVDDDSGEGVEVGCCGVYGDKLPNVLWAVKSWNYIEGESPPLWIISTDEFVSKIRVERRRNNGLRI